MASYILKNPNHNVIILFYDLKTSVYHMNTCYKIW